jgi:two-component system NtrC family response regulator
LSEQAERLIGTSAAIRAVEAEIECAARSDAKVLVTGESGVGKEVIARLVHQQSARVQAPLVAVNCAGIPEALLESALFGHVKGSFTDAHRDRVGLLEMAHRGTIFLDEIGEMTLRMQALLLRFLENGEIQRVGANVLQARVDVRVIAATNRNLLGRIVSKDFREDLYYRLNVIHIPIPPLRARREDIPAFLAHYLRAYAERHHVRPQQLTPDALAHLVAYEWPGNVRELKNAIERVILRSAGSGCITVADLPVEVQRPLPAAAPVTRVADDLFDRMVVAGDSFWDAVHGLFMARDLTRADLKALVRRGLAQTGGNYKILVDLFNMPSGDYRRFLSFLRKYECYLPVQRTKAAAWAPAARQKSHEA